MASKQYSVAASNNPVDISDLLSFFNRVTIAHTVVADNENGESQQRVFILGSQAYVFMGVLYYLYLITSNVVNYT